MICSGGDNSYGLIITELDGEQQQISVNDSIIGRKSSPFIAKVRNVFLPKIRHLVSISEAEVVWGREIIAKSNSTTGHIELPCASIIVRPSENILSEKWFEFNEN